MPFKLDRLALILPILLLSLVSCGSDKGTAPEPPGPVASVTVDATGGTVKTPDGTVELTIPPGALTGEVTITIAKADPTSLPVMPGTHFKYGPDGTTFVKPASLKLTYDVVIDAGEVVGAGWLDEDTGRVQMLSSVHDATNKTVTAEVHHFTAITGVAHAAMYRQIPLNLHTGWEEIYSGIELNWDYLVDFPIVVRRASNNGTIPPAIPVTIFARINDSSRTSLVDYTIGPEAKMYWYWLQYDFGEYLSEPTQAIRFARFGVGDPPIQITNMTVQAIPSDPGGMAISWQPTGTAATYELEHLIAGSGTWVPVASLPFTNYDYTETGLPEDSDITYRVRGNNENGTGPWQQTTGHTGVSCGVEVLAGGILVTAPVLPDTPLTLRAVNCGDTPGLLYQWWYVPSYGGGTEEYLLGEGVEYLIDGTGDTRIRLTVTHNGTEIERQDVVLPVIVPQVYSEIDLTDYKPRYNQTFTALLRTIVNANYVDIMLAYPEVVSIDWTVYAQSDDSVVLTHTGLTRSNWIITGNSLSPGWYDMRVVGRTANGDVFAAPGLTSFQVEN